MKYVDLLNLQLRQLERLLETKRLSFRDSYYVIFSDYPNSESIKSILETIDLDISLSLMKRFYKELKTL